MGIVDKIKDIEDEMKKTQKNKATEGHLGILKARLAKLRTQLLEPAAGGPKGEGFDVKKYGDSRVALIGFPSVGKSTILSMVTETKSDTAAYEFTTLTCIPGVIHYKDAKIQLLDLPGIIEGAAHGQGRGRQVIAVAKSADLVVIVLDASREGTYRHKEILEGELNTVGLRLNQVPPDIYYKKKPTGGISFNSTCKLTKLGNDPQKLVYQVLHEYKIHNAEVLFRGDYRIDELIDIIEGNRKYVKCLYVYNKIDTISLEAIDELARREHSIVISCNLELNIDGFLQALWDNLSLVRVYTKKKGGKPDFSDPLILSESRGGTTVKDACHVVHRDISQNIKYATIWGRSTKHNSQRCGLQHVLADEDVMQIVTKTVEEERHEKGYSNRVQQYYDSYHQKKKKKKPLRS